MGLMPGRGETAIDLMNRLLDRGYVQASGAVLQAITRNSTTGLMARRFEELEREAARLAAEGARLTLDNAVVRAFMADFEDTMRANQALLNSAAGAVQQTGIDAAGPIARQMALPGFTDEMLRAMGIAWNVPNPEAVARLVNYASSDAWAGLVGKYGDDAVAVVKAVAVRGALEGWGPVRTAREMRRMVEGIPPNTANTLMRTLQLTSLRDAQVVHRVSNAEILQEQIRIAALDDRTCFPAGTLITTDSGQKPIETVVVGDRVLTHTGQYRRVSATMCRVYSGQMVTLRHSRGSVAATANHPVLVNREGYGHWIAAESVKAGDQVVVSGEYGGNNRDHVFGRVAIERGVRDTDNGKALRSKARGFLAVALRALVPVNAVNFKRDIQAGQVEVNRIAVNSRFLFVRLTKRLKAQTDVALRFCFTNVTAIAARGAELLIGHRRHNAEVFSARQAGVDHGRATAFLRTMTPFVAADREHLATTLAGGVFGFCHAAFETANSVAVGIGSGYGVSLAAHRADLFNPTTSAAAFRTTEASVPLGDLGRSQLEGLIAYRASERDTLALPYAATSVATEHPVLLTLVEMGLPNVEGLAANRTGSLYHDVIISTTATEVKYTEVFNLEVERDHAYVADGLVVHNCAACVALHGTRLPIDARIDDHHNGRCTSITVLKGRPAPNVQSGEAWFAQRSEAQQRAQMGDAAFEAWRAGRVQLREFAVRTEDPVFGGMIQEASLKGILGSGAREFYGVG